MDALTAQARDDFKRLEASLDSKKKKKEKEEILVEKVEKGMSSKVLAQVKDS